MILIVRVFDFFFKNCWQIFFFFFLFIAGRLLDRLLVDYLISWFLLHHVNQTFISSFIFVLLISQRPITELLSHKALALVYLQLSSSSESKFGRTELGNIIFTNINLVSQVYDFLAGFVISIYFLRCIYQISGMEQTSFLFQQSSKVVLNLLI